MTEPSVAVGEVSRETTVDEVNALLSQAADGPLSGIVDGPARAGSRRNVVTL